MHSTKNMKHKKGSHFLGRIISVMILFATSSAVIAQSLMTEFFVGEPPFHMYVQHWKPRAGVAVQPAPVIMIHGGLHSGTAWTTTPDGRPGWAQQFTDGGWNVYVVDWPGVGRSGYQPETLGESAGDVVNALIKLIDRTGPAVLVGHSIGAALSFKVAERAPDKVRAIASLASAAPELTTTAVPPATLDKLVTAPREVALARFANGDKFPKASFENYFLSLIPYAPRIRNAAVAANDDLKLDRLRLDIWKKIPVLYLIAEQDRTVPAPASEERAGVLGVPATMLGRDWGLTGHAHLYIVEQGSEEIARRVDQWSRKAIQASKNN